MPRVKRVVKPDALSEDLYRFIEEVAVEKGLSIREAFEAWVKRNEGVR